MSNTNISWSCSKYRAPWDADFIQCENHQIKIDAINIKK